MYDEVLDKEPEVIEKEIIKEKIVYRNITIKEPCNLTCEPCIDNLTIYSTEVPREIQLIKRIKFLENQQNKYFNDSECNDNLNKTEKKLDDCKEELCDEWNSSWC